MKHHHLLTVGISLLTNFARERNLSVDDAAKHHKAIADFLHADPCKACAEINSLDSRTGFVRKTSPELGVSLVYTQTAEGKLCAGLIERFLRRKRIGVTRLQLEAIELPGLAGADPQEAQRLAQKGLEKFRTKLLDYVARLRRNDPGLAIEFNATGGYKAECAVLYELGRTLRLPVYYLHETFQVAVELP
jgi:putative CRISPR-associated protein (TIGR02619 family)